MGFTGSSVGWFAVDSERCGLDDVDDADDPKNGGGGGGGGGCKRFILLSDEPIASVETCLWTVLLSIYIQFVGSFASRLNGRKSKRTRKG